MAARDVLAHSEPIITEILTTVLAQSPNLRLALLTECGRTFHSATANVLFKTFLLSDDDQALSPVVCNPTRYAPRIRTLVVVDPPRRHEESTLFELEETDEEEPGIRPLSGRRIKEILEKCENLEALVWASSVPPPDGICEIFTTHTPHLKRFSFAPTSVLLDNSPPLKWDALSLSVLPPLAHLHLTRLSQAGASALASHPPDVQHLELDFVWLDDWVCERLSKIPRVKRITLGTGGTKLTDRGVGALVEGCEALEVLELVEVQGRLSKSLWSNVELSPTLHTLKIALSESGPHHSWTADHLLSLPLLAGLDQLTTISITRTYNGQGQIDDVAIARPVPKDMVDALRECNNLKHLECDWWAWGADDLKELVEGCVNLQTLRITLDAPFTRLLSLTSSFAHLAHLTHLYVSISSTHAPSAPPSPVLQTPGMSPIGLVNGYGIGVGVGGIMIGSPTSSPLSLTRSLKSPAQLVLPVPLPENESPIASPVVGAGNTNEALDHTLDAIVPPLRDVRKFMRRCPKLILLEWFGRTGRGAWVAHREDAKSVAGIKVEYQACCADEPSTWPCSSFLGGVPRSGAEWTGPEAEAAAEAVREYEAERDREIEREKEAKRKVSAAGRKRGATVSSGVADGCVVGNGKPRRRQSSASEGLGKPKVPASPGSRRNGARRSP